MPDVVVSEQITGPAIDALGGTFEVLSDANLWRDGDRLRHALTDARALLVRNQTQVTEALIAAAPALQVIARAGVGLDNIDTEAATRAGVVVTYAPSENSVTAAELTMGLLLALARQIPAADRDTRQGGWKRQVFTGTEVSGKRLGIVGFGRIGQLVARRAQAFEMNVVAHDVMVTADRFAELGVTSCSLEALLQSSDYISLHVPLTPTTRQLINRARLALVKPGARLINAARGEVVEEEALIEALDSGRLAGAALDVRDPEPPARSKFEEMDSVILTPHIAGFTKEAQARVVAAVCRDIENVLTGGSAQNAFNFPTPRRKV